MMAVPEKMRLRVLTSKVHKVALDTALTRQVASIPTGDMANATTDPSVTMRLAF